LHNILIVASQVFVSYHKNGLVIVTIPVVLKLCAAAHQRAARDPQVCRGTFRNFWI